MSEVGIDVTSCIIGIKGQTPSSTNQVDVWFDSLKSIASVLSEENQHLLKIIADKKPENITELSELTGRAVSNLSRTIKTLEKHGLINIESFGKSIRPKIKYSNFNILCDLSFSGGKKDLLENKFTLVSMFTGVGGLDMGFEGGFKYKDKYFESQPFSTLAAYEKDEKCVETIKKNLDIPISQVELSEELVNDFPSADVLIGGFPCQDFSSCGPKRGLSSDRGQLYKVLVKYMQHHKPKIVCAENVPNLARMQKGAVLETIVNDFSEQGYKVQVWDLFAPDYGVPQSRRRLFFVCTRNDLEGEPLKPEPKFVGMHRGTKWAIEDLEKVIDETIPNQSQYFKASKAKKGNGQGDEHCKADEPSYTIRANAKSRVQFHYELDRRLTIRECARLQTFPDSFVFPHSATSNVMQIGNAVPPMLSYEVATSIKEFLLKQD
ncbi:3',5'-cyclic-nucleotide phosphodiesterase [Pseudoalteromonas sp. SCSIO_11900]|uniref:DNA (cytosine-5-)-methyltransferase n=1 Tax=Pseudoalteromonas sp. SCSIO_11900 TaxID=1461766 RepID=UPI000445DE00|nr:DNA (cytosine-5-)-methyltransferase [Pseudoalteromonas sp. SCSIO_11900]EWS98921.1 3',5'-cyclic-nucleotide phosphodiesterase [Pseudoalteromonas sp. SCSIO_11900]